VETKDDYAEADDTVSDSSTKKAQMGQTDGPCPSGSQPMPGNLLAILECPVCMIVYQDRVMMCSNGHSICGKCLENLPDSRCPTCRVKMGTIRNRIVERMLETALLPCVYKDYGCKYVGRGGTRAGHEDTCMFRPIPCLLRRCYPSCKWEGTPSSLVEHLNTHCSVRNVEPDTLDDVYWSYKTDKDCFQRGKDAAYFLPWCQRFYYVSISKRGDLFHLAALWFALSPKAAEEAQRRIKMELVFPLDKNQSVSYSLYPPRLLPGEVLDDQISHLIKTNQSFIVPIRRWRREWSESKHKCYFQVRARWTEPGSTTTHTIAADRNDNWKCPVVTGNANRRKGPASISPPPTASAPCPPSPGSVNNCIEAPVSKKGFEEMKASPTPPKNTVSVASGTQDPRPFSGAETRATIVGETPPRLSLRDLEPNDSKRR